MTVVGEVPCPACGSAKGVPCDTDGVHEARATAAMLSIFGITDDTPLPPADGDTTKEPGHSEE